MLRVFIGAMAIGLTGISCATRDSSSLERANADKAYIRTEMSSAASYSVGFAPRSASSDVAIEDPWSVVPGTRHVTVFGFGDYPVDRIGVSANLKLAAARAAFVLRHLKVRRAQFITTIAIGGPSPFLRPEASTAEVFLGK
jgi:hypothetical protein